MNFKIIMAAIALLPITLCAKSYGLEELIAQGSKTNQLLESRRLQILAKEREVDAGESAFAPTLGVGANYLNNNVSSVAMPGETLSGYATLGLEIFDGGRRNALVNSKIYQRQISIFEKEAFEKSLSLNIINNFYTIKISKSNLEALQAASKELEAQLNRIRRFLTVGMAAQEDVDRLQAQYDDNDYLIENIKLEIITNEENLWLNSGINTKELLENHFVEPRNVQYEIYEKTKILQNSALAIGEQADAVASGYLPQIGLNDTYTKSDYNKLETIPGLSGGGFLIDEQNRLSITANLRIFDGGRIKEEREALQYQKMSVASESLHSQSEQQMNFKIANSRLQTTRAKIKSAQSALKASQSTYRVIVKKFENGLVDNIAFLDALQQQTRAEAAYRATLYSYEIAKSIYYFYAGKNPREYIR